MHTTFPLPILTLALLTAVAPAQLAGKRLEAAPFQPAGRTGHGAAFDIARNQMVVFGGVNDTGVLSETLVNGSAWSQLTPATAPAGRHGARLAFAPDTGTCLLFGGNDALLWSWNGTTWSSISKGGQPLARTGHAMAYDPTRKRLVMHGGRSIDFNNVLDDVWEYDAAAGWVNVKVHGTTPGVVGAAMVHAPNLSGVLMLGGVIHNGNHTGYAFVWNGSSWNNVAGANSPSKRAECAMCYDTDQHTTVVFGGFDGTKVLGDTWCGYGIKFTDRTRAGPSPRRGATLVYDPRGKKCVLYGGVDASSKYPPEVWEWDNSTHQWTQRPGQPEPPKLMAPPGRKPPPRGGG